MTKTCFKCHEEKSIDDFYRHGAMSDGRLGKCKECTKKDTKNDYRANPEKHREYEKLREQRPERRAAKAQAKRMHRERHPDRYKARSAVSNAIRDGRLVRLPCQICGEKKSQAHHHDYSKPLDVEWMCFKCHRLHAHGQDVLTKVA